jgi:MoaA/NifB/PqqE/SkfB family radical SAM enzyme
MDFFNNGLSFNHIKACAPVRAANTSNLCAPVRAKYLFEKETDAHRSLDTSLIWLEITNKCNLKCLHCYSNATESGFEARMTRTDWANCLKDFAAAGGKNVQFTGGEPTLNDDLPSLISVAESYMFDSIEVYTNGTCLDDNLLHFFHEHGVCLAFSIYGHNPFSHDYITQTPGSFEKTVKAIIKAQKLGIQLRVGVIIVDDSLQHIQKIKQFLDVLNVKSVCIDFVRKVGRGCNLASGCYLECQRECQHIIKQCVSANGDIFPCVFQRITHR